MPSCNFYQATGKDVIDIANILKKFKEDLVDCDYPDIDNDKLNNFILGMLKKGKIICVKNLDDDKLIGVCIFYKTEYWWSKEQTMVIQLIYVLKKYRNYQVVKQLVDSVKQVAENLPISLSIIAKLNADKLLKRLGFEQMGNNWRLK
jgi:N-acetylglutamate synthase-like GNAT family acetyltransferase|tara:strand:+ start:94 stop:534 length:441 start_codon:yes stop_codon:yes gene_type:complete